MEAGVSLLKSMLPQVLKQVSDCIQVDVTIKLFGVKVFSFTWPPESEIVKSKNS